MFAMFGTSIDYKVYTKHVYCAFYSYLASSAVSISIINLFIRRA